MDYAEVLEALNKQEGGAALVEVITAKVSSLNSEAASWRTKLRETESQLKRLQDLAGSDGKTLESKLQELTTQVATLTAERDTAKTEAAEATSAKSGLEKSLHLQSAAVKAGADPEALKKLLADLPLERIKLTDSNVVISSDDGSETPLADYAKAQGEWVTRALFPNASTTSTPQPPKKPTLPSGGINTSTKPETPDPVKAYISRTYKPPIKNS